MTYGYEYPRKQALPWTPLRLGSDLVAWYDAMDTGTITIDGASRVSQWADKSCHGYHLAQSTTSYRPAVGTGINGRQSIYYDGTDWLKTTSVGLSVFDIYIVIKTSSTAKFVYEHGVGTLYSDGSQVFSGLYPSTAVNRSAVMSGRHASSGTWLGNGVACVIRHGHDGTHAGHIIQRNGTTVANTTPVWTGNPGTGTVTKDFFLGTSNGASIITADFGEIIIVGTAPDSTTNTLVLQYLRNKWGTP